MKRAHEVDFKVHGDDMQFVEIQLDQNETIIAEAGAMMYMDQNIRMETIFGDGSGSDEGKGLMGKVLGAGKRVLTGESLFMTSFTNTAPDRKSVAFAAPYPGRIVPLDLSEYSGEIICQRDAFLCAAKGIRVEMAGNVKSALFGGEGLFLATLRGPGHVWLQSLPFSRLANRIYAASGGMGGGKSKDEGSLLGNIGIGDLFGRD